MRLIPGFAMVAPLVYVGRPALSADDALLLHYTFQEGSGVRIHDQSGHGLDGTIEGQVEWARTPRGRALVFNGEDTCVECGSAAAFGANNAGTIEIWGHLQAHQGGLVSRTNGPDWSNHRLSLAFWTEGGMVKYLAITFGDGASVEREMIHEREAAHAIPPLNRWSHVVLTFDPASGLLYVDGRLMQRYVRSMAPEVSGVPLRIGRCEFTPLGTQYIKGMLDEVKLYDRPISAEEVLAHFKQGAGERSVDTSCVAKVQVHPTPIPDKGELLIEASLHGLWPIARGDSLSVSVRPSLRFAPGPAGPGRTRARRVPLSPGMDRVRVSLDLRGAPPGDYQVVAVPRKNRGRAQTGESVADFQWSGPSPAFAPGSGVKVLNNLVMELLHAKPAEPGREYAFTNPYDGWVFFAASARTTGGGTARVCLGSDEEIVLAAAGQGDGDREAMRFLRAGRHVLRVRGAGAARLDSLIVRAIPELQYAVFFPGKGYPTVAHYGPYDWEFHRRYVLPHTNCLIAHQDVLLNEAYRPLIQDWRNRGQRWLVDALLPDRPGSGVHPYYDDVPVERSYEYWSQSLGLTSPLADGITIDEFGSGAEAPRYYGWAQAIDQIHRAGRHQGKTFYAYTQPGFFSGSATADFARTLIRNGGRLIPEYYLCERPTEATADEAFERIRLDLVGWERTIPGSARHLIPAIGYMSLTTTESLNTDPAVDFKVFLDRAMHLLANDPAFFKLYGVQFYNAGYADEETVRWASRLMRHYGIEGRKNLLSEEYGFQYRPGLIRNPDFEDGLAGWDVSPAREDTVSAGRLKGLSQMEGRYPGLGQGNTHLLTVRSAQRPNQVSQEIQGLRPGRLYSVTMITGDRQNIVNNRQVEEMHAVSIRIDPAEFLPDKCFQEPVMWVRKAGLNYHRKVFRARRTTARLTISDWADEKNPGGPIGQEMVYNFVEVQPYFE